MCKEASMRTITPGRVAFLLVMLLTVFCLAFATEASRRANIEIFPRNPTEDDPITVRLYGRWPNSCIPQNPRATLYFNTLEIATSNPGMICLPAETPWELEVPIGKLSSGRYRINMTFNSESVAQMRFIVEEGEPEPDLGRAYVDVHPEQPTEDDAVTLIIYGNWRNSCTPESPQLSIVDNTITVATSNPSTYCLAVVSPWELEVPVGQLSTGTYDVVVSFDDETIGKDSFSVDPAIGTAYIDVEPDEPTEDDAVTLIIYGNWRNSCTPESPQLSIVDNTITVATSNPSMYCLPAVSPWELEVPVGKLSAGMYDVIVTFETDTIGQDAFEVTASPASEQDMTRTCDLYIVAMQGGKTTPRHARTHTYTCGDTVVVEAIPAEGWAFARWEGGGSAAACPPHRNPCVFVIEEGTGHEHDAWLIAHFTELDDEYEPPAARQIFIDIIPADAQPGDPATIHVHGTWNNSCVPRLVEHVRSPDEHIRIEAINRQEQCLMALTDFSFRVEIGSLPYQFFVDVYHEEVPSRTYELIASEWFAP